MCKKRCKCKWQARMPRLPQSLNLEARGVLAEKMESERSTPQLLWQLIDSLIGRGHTLLTTLVDAHVSWTEDQRMHHCIGSGCIGVHPLPALRHHRSSLFRFAAISQRSMLCPSTMLSLPSTSFLTNTVLWLVACHLVDYLREWKPFPVLQSACHTYHSTETTVFRVLSDIIEVLDQGDLAALTLLDHGSYSQGKSGNFKKSGKIQTVRGSQGIQKYHGAKVNKDAGKKQNCCTHTAYSSSKFFSARFACRLFILLLFYLFCCPCF